METIEILKETFDELHADMRQLAKCKGVAIFVQNHLDKGEDDIESLKYYVNAILEELK